VETLVLAGDVNAGDVVILPDGQDEVLVKQGGPTGIRLT
jgi:hypothetical protein